MKLPEPAKKPEKATDQLSDMVPAGASRDSAGT